MIRISVNTRHAYKVYTEMITSGSSGIPVTFSFSPEWDGLTKIATFSGSGVQRDMVLTSLSVVVPAEVLTTAGGDLMIGVYGTDGQDGAVIIPTVWANAGRIRAGVVPCCETDPQPTATVIDQVLAAAANAVEQADEAAKAQAEIAAGHAEDAANSASAAAGSATAAAESAASASASKTAAAGSASAAHADSAAAIAAKNAAETAQGVAEEARDTAVSAKNAAETAQRKAETAQGKAETAKTAAEAAAQSASGSASSASASATAAGSSATSAAGSASAAHTDAAAALEAKNTAVSAKDTAVAAKDTAVASKIAAEAAQRAAENAATNASGSATAAAGSATAAAGSATDAAASAKAAAGSADEAEAVLDSIPEDYSTLSSDVTDLKSAVNVDNTITAYKAVFDCEYITTPLTITTNISYAGYVIPTTKIWHFSKDLHNPEQDTLNATLSASGEAYNSSVNRRVTDYINISGLTNVYIGLFFHVPSSFRSRIWTYDENKLPLAEKFSEAGTNFGKAVNINVTGATYIRICYYNDSASNYLSYVIVSTDYNTYSVTLPSNYYGGTVDYNNGIITSMYDSEGNLLDPPVATNITPFVENPYYSENTVFATGQSVPYKTYKTTIIYKETLVNYIDSEITKLSNDVNAEINESNTNITKNTDNINQLMTDIFPSESEIPLDVLHRGLATAGYPENTIVAYKDAITKGWKYLETDIRQTSDGVWVLLHDSDINRVARNADGSSISGSIYISDITYSDALTYDFGIAAGAQFAGTKIATLDAFLNLCSKAHVYPVIEIKNSSITEEQAATVWDIVKKYQMQNRCMWLCTSFGGIEWFLKFNPYAPCVQTSSSEWQYVDVSALTPSSSKPYAYQYYTGKNRVFHAHSVSGFNSKELMDNMIDYYHYFGLYGGIYSPTTQSGIEACSDRADYATTQYLKYSDVKADEIE